MKKLLIVFLAAIFIIGCGKDEQKPITKDTSVVDTSGVLQLEKDNAPAAGVSVEYKLPKDAKLTYRLTSISNSVQSVTSDSSMKQLLKQSISYIFNLDVIDVDADNIMDIKVTIPSITVDADANGQKFHYKSGSKMDSVDRMKYLEYEAVINNPFNIRVEPKGDIIEIYRVDKIANKFLELQGVKNTIPAEQKKQFQTNISESALRPLLQQLFRILPAKGVSKDSVWTHKYVNRAGVYELDNTAIYTVKDFGTSNGDHIVVVDAGLDTKPRGKGKVSDRGINYDFGKPVAEGSGTIYFNLDKGRIEKAKTRTSLKMTIKMDMPQTPQGPMKAVRDDFVENINIVEML